jgi:hypothetical protein
MHFSEFIVFLNSYESYLMLITAIFNVLSGIG